MATIFNEDNTIEQMMLSTLQKNGWKYIPAEELPRMYSDVLVEPMVKEALIRLNPEIAEDPSRADEVINLGHLFCLFNHITLSLRMRFSRK